MNRGFKLCLLLPIFVFGRVDFSKVDVEKKNVNIIFIGDSITEGDGAGAPPVHASRFLLHQTGIASLNFSNQGHSGFTTVNFLPEQGHTFKEVEKAADSLGKLNDVPVVFSIMLGTNDSAMDGPLGSPVSPAAYRDNLMVITDRLIKDYKGCRIIFQYPTWYSPNTHNGSRYMAEGLRRLQSYFHEIKSLVDSYQQKHPGQVYGGDQSAFDFFRKNYKAFLIPEQGQDGTFYLHPNKDGAKRLGDFWGKAIYKVIMKS